MTDPPQASFGSVAEEAARLISAVADMARSSTVASQDPSPYAGEPAHRHTSPEDEQPTDSSAGGPSAEERRAGHGAGATTGAACSDCGEASGATPVACQLCPLCQGIALLRSVRPETVDRLADLASAMAASLRDVATQSRASGAWSAAPSGSGRPSGGSHATVQDIPVDDDDEGWRS